MTNRIDSLLKDMSSLGSKFELKYGEVSEEAYIADSRYYFSYVDASNKTNLGNIIKDARAQIHRCAKAFWLVNEVW